MCELSSELIVPAQVPLCKIVAQRLLSSRRLMLIPGFPAQSSSAQTAIAQAAIALQADGHKGVVVKSGIGRGHWMCEIPNGSRIDVLEERDDHYRVRFGDKEGWAKAKNFSIMASGSSDSTSPYSAQMEEGSARFLRPKKRGQPKGRARKNEKKRKRKRLEEGDDIDTWGSKDQEDQVH